MKIHRFIGKFDLDGRELVIKDPKVIHQISKVLRLKHGDQVILGNGQGSETLSDIKKIEKSSILVALPEKIQRQKEEASGVSLYLAILKKENFELVAQKATEIGISELIPIHTTRVVKQNLNEERIRKIIKEATEQSGRVRLPELLPTFLLADALERSRKSEERWFLDEEGMPLKIFEKSKKVKSISLFVGPEGGWTNEEKEMALGKSLKMVRINPHTLRAETAGIIASHIGISLLEENQKTKTK